jgi:hypothetical protein
MGANETSVWDQRYAGEDYLFGQAPNGFLAAQAPRLQSGKSAWLWLTERDETASGSRRSHTA